MKTKAICSFFVLFAIVAGIVATTPAAFADHSEVTIETAAGSGAPGCEDTAEGCYIPSTATVDVGGKVIMSNTDTAAHTFTAGTPEDGPSGEFDTGLLMAGNSFEYSPDTVGEINYFCMVHPWMQGLIVVQEAGAEEAMDEHADEHDDEMMDMEGAATATGMLSDGTMVSIWTSTPTAGEAMEISIEFDDAEHVNHDMMVTQNGVEVLMDEGAHHHEGTGMHTTAPLSSSDPVNITITFQGYGVEDPKTGPIGEQVVFSNVVPEFGTIAMMVLAVAIISIVAVTAKSRVIPRF
jgi:predicted secreted protein with PEFG-CTERM motif